MVRVCTVEVVALQLLACGLFWQVALTRSGSRDAWVVTGMLLGLSAFRAVSWLIARRTRAWGPMKGKWEGTLWGTAHVHARRVLYVVDYPATAAATACLIVALLLMRDPVWFWVIPLITGAVFAGDAIALSFVAGDLAGAGGGEGSVREGPGNPPMNADGGDVSGACSRNTTLPE